jgi:hypothetical protein
MIDEDKLFHSKKNVIHVCLFHETSVPRKVAKKREAEQAAVIL